jgi:hypothetical protein
MESLTLGEKASAERLAVAFASFDGDVLKLLFFPGAGVTSETGRSQCASRIFKAALLFSLVSLLVRPELADHRHFIRIGRGGDR